MKTLPGLAVLFATFFAALILTRAVRAYARRRHLLDHPNERSAHATPTPRLGGIGILVAFLAAALGLGAGVAEQALLVTVCATAAIATLGLVDDIRPLPARWRFVVQVAAAVAVVITGRHDLGVALVPFDGLPTPLLAVGAVIWIVWVTNLYNFMDGIDGLAGGQAVWASLGLAAAAFSVGDALMAWVLLALAAASAGFLRYNLPKASIFMGDVGSTAIGFFLASVPFASGPTPVPAVAVALALSLFILDATTTLVRRVVRGERWFVAHRTHLYQRPLALGISHARITYPAWAGMALVAALAARYPGAGWSARAGMLLVAVGLFGGAWLWVRAHERVGQTLRPELF
jgi:Fuc2NAc and GlcNAc transferase